VFPHFGVTSDIAGSGYIS